MNTRTSLLAVTLVLAFAIQLVRGQDATSKPETQQNAQRVNGQSDAGVQSDASFTSGNSQESANEFMVFKLTYATASSVRHQLRQVYADMDLQLRADERSNSLFVFGPPAALAEITDLVTKLDSDDEVDRLEAATRKLAREYAKVKDIRKYQREVSPRSEPDKKKQELRDAVKSTFEARQRLQRAELGRLQQELQSIQRQIDTRDQLKDQIIDKRVEELINPDIQWDALSPRKPRSESLPERLRPAGGLGQPIEDTKREPAPTGGFRFSRRLPIEDTKREPAPTDSTSQDNVPATQPIVASQDATTAEYFQIRDHYVKEKAQRSSTPRPGKQWSGRDSPGRKHSAFTN